MPVGRGNVTLHIYDAGQALIEAEDASQALESVSGSRYRRRTVRHPESIEYNQQQTVQSENLL